MTDHNDIGYLTWNEWERFQTAVNTSLYLEPWLRAAGYIKTEPSEIRQPTNNHPLGVPPTWIAAEEIHRLSTELSPWENLEDIPNDWNGAYYARAFTREVETALKKWPIQDKPHAVRHLRCQACYAETIHYQPPTHQGNNTTIACTNCGQTLTIEEFETLLTLLTEDLKKADKKNERIRRMGTT